MSEGNNAMPFVPGHLHIEARGSQMLMVEKHWKRRGRIKGVALYSVSTMDHGRGEGLLGACKFTCENKSS